MSALKKPMAKLILPIIGLVSVLVLSIVVGALRTNADGDDDCNCLKKSDAGWRGFSITWFIGSVLLIALAFVGIYRSNSARTLMGLAART